MHEIQTNQRSKHTTRFRISHTSTMAQKSIDCGNIEKETQQLAGALLLHLVRKLPPRRWWFIPRNKEEGTATNAINTMLSVPFDDIQPICLLSGVLYEHVASKGPKKGEIVTSFNEKAWKQLDPANEYVLLPRRPRIDGVQKSFLFILNGVPRDGDDKPVPIYPLSLPSYYSPLPRSKRVGRATFSNCRKLAASLESFQNESKNCSGNIIEATGTSRRLSTIPEDEVVEYVLEGNESDSAPPIICQDGEILDDDANGSENAIAIDNNNQLEVVVNNITIPGADNNNHTERSAYNNRPNVPIRQLMRDPKEARDQAIRDIVSFAGILDFDRRSSHGKRLCRKGDREIDIVDRKQLSNEERLAVLWLCSEWKYGESTRKQQSKLAHAACSLVCYDKGFAKPVGCTQVKLWYQSMLDASNNGIDLGLPRQSGRKKIPRNITNLFIIGITIP